MDDFYHNLLDWSSTNVLGVGLGKNVYLWDGKTSKVEDLRTSQHHADIVSSVSWSQGASAIAVGTKEGILSLWNPQTQDQILRFSKGHPTRIGSLSWNLNMLASGGRDALIRYWDPRKNRSVHSMKGHNSEVCGLKVMDFGYAPFEMGLSGRAIIFI